MLLLFRSWSNFGCVQLGKLKMGFEIERKFTVNHSKWNEIEKPEGDHYRQGYLSKENGKTVRIRLTTSTAFLTIKGPTKGLTRDEYEFEIPQLEATEILDTMCYAEVVKIRYKLVYAGKLWEVDEYLGDNQGLLTAEIELANEKESFEIPPWIEKEVTFEKKYSNSNLAAKPFKTWFL